MADKSAIGARELKCAPLMPPTFVVGLFCESSFIGSPLVLAFFLSKRFLRVKVEEDCARYSARDNNPAGQSPDSAYAGDG
jgi:hypothetical protein